VLQGHVRGLRYESVYVRTKRSTHIRYTILHTTENDHRMNQHMMPIGPLMIEHRLIERMVALMKVDAARMNEQNKAELGFVDMAGDFIRTYADRTHHGKEEDILFRDLSKKPLSVDLSKTMRELVEEHVQGRDCVRRLTSARDSYAHGSTEALHDILSALDELVQFYPKHIEKEDRHFFLPCMDYLTKDEQRKMLDEMGEFDRKMIHEKYRKMVEALEERPA
jgi:hemerythrin-like domain-containing protein